MRAFTGFDSAWTDDEANPGAILTIYENDSGKLSCGIPELATFQQALSQVLSASRSVSFHLVAIDQPTIVPNASGCRPVERVASSLVCKLKGGVQPANRGKIGMFCDDSAIWRFLAALPHVQNPARAHSTTDGNFLIEAFPALALAGWIPEIMQRGKSAKYNPSRRSTFALDDWKMVCRCVCERAHRVGLEVLEGWSVDCSRIAHPKKADQDRLDAAICALIALEFAQFGLDRSSVIGDPTNGYIVAPVSDDTQIILRSAAERFQVPFNDVGIWG